MFYSPLVGEDPYWLLDTDYDSFAAVYSCTVGEPVDSPTTYGWLVTRYGISPTFDLKKSFLDRCEFNLLSNAGESPKGYFSRALDKVVFFSFYFQGDPAQPGGDRQGHRGLRVQGDLARQVQACPPGARGRLQGLPTLPGGLRGARVRRGQKVEKKVERFAK